MRTLHDPNRLLRHCLACRCHRGERSRAIHPGDVDRHRDRRVCCGGAGATVVVTSLATASSGVWSPMRQVRFRSRTSMRDAI